MMRAGTAVAAALALLPASATLGEDNATGKCTFSSDRGFLTSDDAVDVPEELETRRVGDGNDRHPSGSLACQCDVDSAVYREGNWAQQDEGQARCAFIECGLIRIDNG
ncbi:hypothetical protein [Bradyrhizobium brasilense]|uniref:hypothetical protein n=1 Tax=Bradyrhizobium brasilense TaxID=1419277 RepID=UPI001E543DB4|nr:hypothetical protein [Bradyrhizobium brasilense]MCC8972232.1 hypothetical protein [Bradyrhizobium brasilense]